MCDPFNPYWYWTSSTPEPCSLGGGPTEPLCPSRVVTEEVGVLVKGDLGKEEWRKSGSSHPTTDTRSHPTPETISVVVGTVE